MSPVSILLYLYVLVSLINVMGEFLRFNFGIRYITTPMMMPILAAWFYIQLGWNWPLMTILLLFWIGDIIHMFGDETDRKTLGIVLFLFLIGHLIFVRFFWLNITSLQDLPIAIWGGAILLSFITLAMVYTMRKSLWELAMPVIIYALALITMGVVILLNYNSLPRAAFIRALAGISLFIISGSAIGYHQIVKNYSWYRQALMGTYFPGVFFLVQALVMMGI